MSDERKPLWPWIVALLIGLPVLYVASFGPACWWFSDESFIGVTHFRVIPRFYWPVEWLIRNGPDFIASPLLWYGAAFTPEHLIGFAN
jgi:hypothetical protein